jgi:uncharacterized protein DUF4129
LKVIKLIILFLVLNCTMLQAQEIDNLSKNDSKQFNINLNDSLDEVSAIVYDSSEVLQRNASEYVERLRSKKDFEYPITPKDEESLWDKFWRFIMSLLYGNIFSLGEISITQIILFAIVVAAVVLLVIWLNKQGTGGMFGKKDAKNELDFEEIEDIKDIDISILIQQAVDNQNYREAVRLLYLRSLQKMSELELIRWRNDATNREYINELKNASTRTDFSRLTLQFDYINYGEFPLTLTKFTHVRKMFEKFDDSLGGGA